MVNTVKYIYVANRNPERLTELSVLLKERFGSLFSIRMFNDNNSAINSIDDKTEVVIFDNSIESDNKELTLMTMKNSHPKIKAVMRSTSSEIEMAVDDYCKRKSFYLFRKGKTWERISPFIYNVTYPIRVFVYEFFVRIFLVVFLLTFLLMGIGIYYVMNYTD
jgi:DNA-binding NtrC family response regulator